jgi:exopolyphosphatase/guanosine-5'-triphosphate,3'-diphosphate pyrophosphatase
MLLGAIDVGTNSIHLIVVELDPRFGTSRTILKAREMVRLGGGDALARGHLSKKAVQRGVAAIAKFAAAARTDVLDDVEEARLIHLGVSRGYPLGDRVACIFDIGGGSTEFVVGDADRAYYLHSVRAGSLRLYDEYLRDESAGNLGYRALEKYVRATIAPVAAQLADYRFDTLIGTSGTVLGLAALDVADTGIATQRSHGYVLGLDRVRALQKTMIKLGPIERRKMPGMNPRRSDIIVAGTAIVIAVMEALERDELVVSERALREGIVVDYLERNIAIARKLGNEQTRRIDAALGLARRFGQLDAHQYHVGALALQIFDGLSELHRFEPADRDALFAAAIVHDVGRSIAISAHHKHGAYIVRNAGLAGWRPEEVELIAALVRYHRKSQPKPTHAEWASASPALRRKIEGLGGILRVADGLDLRRLSVVSALNLSVTATTVDLVLETTQDARSEIDGARFKSDLFERAFGRTLAFTAVERAGYATPFDSEPSVAEIDTASLLG